ncbi:hypothetical protein SAMN05444411_101694 [Lutibacter oricola]|uniref:Uncharacterized protein n=1 Tax=Lutibacter oricola TaxID=762486 RepID=A0A1H2TFH7_9FLAO|nr:hypothetical protein [Lutibacter oricola]SDW42706.1 hypothetical protein SAMN05444411_101694 [Lutibacter oricola]
MKDFLEKIKLIEYFTVELEIQKFDFVSILKKHVDEGDTGIFSDTFDIFSSSKNEYKGQVDFNGFKIKRRKRLFDMNMNFAIAKGNFSQKNEKLIVETEVNGFSNMMIPFYIIGVVFYTIFIGAFFMADNIEGNGVGFALPFILIHGAFMFGIPYVFMRRSAKRMKYELEREFYYLIKK